MTPGENNLNGIEAVGKGSILLGVQTSEGVLWRIRRSDGSHVPVDLHGADLENGDGLLLVGKRTLLWSTARTRSREVEPALPVRPRRPDARRPPSIGSRG